MVKKLIVLVTVFIMLLSLMACNDFAFLKYQEIAKDEIERYVQDLESSDYTSMNWARIEQQALEGKKAVDEAMDKAGVDASIVAAKSGIDAVPKGNAMNIFYTLQEAYDNGFLKIIDLESIAYYHNDPLRPNHPEVLDPNIEQAIKEAVAESMRNELWSESIVVKVEDFVITRYYGNYDGYVAFLINDPYHQPPAEIVDIWVTVAGVSFHYRGHNRITVFDFNKTK